MKIIKKILIEALETDILTLKWEDETGSLDDLFKNETYNVLLEIKNSLEDSSMSDFDCIDEIIRIFSNSGITVLYRHDF
jgi:hypothetical protein